MQQLGEGGCAQPSMAAYLPALCSGDPAALHSELQLKALVMSLPGKEQDGSSAKWKCQPTEQGAG